MVNKNIIVPEVYTELVREKIKGAMKVGQFNKIIGDLQGKVGETVTMPKWAYIGDASDIEAGAAMPASQMKQTSTQTKVKMVAAPAITVYDYDSETELGNALDEAASQQAVSIARKIDIDSINAALTSPLKTKTAAKNVVTASEMLEAFGLYGDDRNVADFAGIVAHSNFVKSFVEMPEFTSVEKTFNQAGNGVTINGCIGYFLGVPVFLSDRCYDATNAEAELLVIKKDSIGYLPKEEPYIEVARDASKRANTIFASQIYALTLIDDSGVVIVKNIVA